MTPVAALYTVPWRQARLQQRRHRIDSMLSQQKRVIIFTTARGEQQRVQQHQWRESETPRGKQREDQDRFCQQRRRASETPEFMRGVSGAEYTFLSPRFTAPLVCEPYYLSKFLCSSPLTCNIIFIVVTF